MKEIDISLYNYIRENSSDMPRNTLYYLLLDWADQHQELNVELLKKHDSYRVNIFDKDREVNKYESVIFTGNNFKNPLIEAKRYIKRLKELHPELIYEIWLNPNPYRPGPFRNGKLIESSDKNE